MKYIISIFIVMFMCTSLYGASLRRGGEDKTTKSLRMEGIRSTKHFRNNKGRLMWYTIEFNASSRRKMPIEATITLRAVDRDGYRVEEFTFYNIEFNPRDERHLKEKTVMENSKYKKISKWKVQKVRVKIKKRKK